MSDLKQKLHLAAGLNFDIEEKLASLSTDEEKQAFFNRLCWMMPGGVINTSGSKAEAIAKTIVNIAEELDIPLEGDVNGDGKIDDSDKRITSKVEILTSEDENPEESDDLEIVVTSEGEAVVGNIVTTKVSLKSKKYEGTKVYVKVYITPEGLTKPVYAGYELPTLTDSKGKYYLFGAPGNGFPLTSSAVSTFENQCLAPGEVTTTLNIINDETSEVIGEGSLTVTIKAKEVEPSEDPTEPEEEKSLLEQLEEGGTVVIDEDLDVPAMITPKKDLTIVLNKNITTTNANDFMSIENGITVNISGEGKITFPLPAKDEGGRIFHIINGTLNIKSGNFDGPRIVTLNGENAKANIESGVFTTPYGNVPLVYVNANGGKATITGGEFKVVYQGSSEYTNNYLLNLRDLLNNSGKPASDYIEVSGGDFWNFDPSQSISENPTVSFVKEGYTVKEDVKSEKITVYTVEKA